jgi:hypothetical protein
VLSEPSGLFSADQKARLLDYCVATGCSEKFVKGYGDAGLLVAFKHGCSNNSLPVLWVTSDDWQGLFRRRAI